MAKEKWKNGKKFSPATIIFHSTIRGIIINHLKTHSSRTRVFFPFPLINRLPTTIIFQLIFELGLMQLHGKRIISHTVKNRRKYPSISTLTPICNNDKPHKLQYHRKDDTIVIIERIRNRTTLFNFTLIRAQLF